jgi:hypothetical protein
MDGAFGVHVESEIHISWLNIGNEIWTQHAGHIHHGVDSREALDRSLHCPLPLSGIANIKWADLQSIRCSGRGVELVDGRGVDVASHDGVATCKQGAGESKTEAAGGSGDQVIFHAEDDRREQSTQQSALSSQP